MNVLRTLNSAVRRRQSEGETRLSIAEKIGCNRSQLSRTLNGSVPNLTLRTISDILWATGHEPVDFEADAWEDISLNFPVKKSVEVHTVYVATPSFYTASQQNRPLHSAGSQGFSSESPYFTSPINEGQNLIKRFELTDTL